MAITQAVVATFALFGDGTSNVVVINLRDQPVTLGLDQSSQVPFLDGINWRSASSAALVIPTLGSASISGTDLTLTFASGTTIPTTGRTVAVQIFF